ncbi:MAG TPA: hypothetical protein VMT03_06560 [Polyangia bacterium]|nr:hypothetical protein [Polyangia bacterium]
MNRRIAMIASALWLTACANSVGTSPGSSTGGNSATGGSPAATGGKGGVSTATGGAPATGGTSGAGKGTGGLQATGGASPAGAAGGPAGGAKGSAGAGGAAVAVGTGGSGGATTEAMDHCTYGYAVDPRDSQVTDTPDQWVSPMNQAIDLVLPAGVLGFMNDYVWKQSHDAWHDIRRCNGGQTQTSYGVNVCAQKTLVPAHQECSDAEDGFEFLAMHRHMIQALKQAFPTHTDLFAGFPHFPFNATDVPQQWQSRWGTGWSQQIISTANTLEAIETNVSMFATDGDLGKYIQCGVASSGASSIHGALHFKWVVNDSPYSLGSQPVNIQNYMFWKLHGWIDEIWERYRVAKGEKDDDPMLVQEIHDKCVEMHQLGLLFDPTQATKPDAPLPIESGYFHETVRPILEQVCSGCHGDSSPQANMSLGGHISSADIVKNLVNVTTEFGGQFKRIVPNNVNQSWLYLKASGMAMSAGCQGSDCNTEVMPPVGQVTLTSDQLAIIANWINMGAPAPTEGASGQ